VPPPPGGHTARELIVRANARHSAGRLNEAIAGYGEALALDPMNAEARMLLGIALYKGDDAHAAANALRAALFVAPSLWPAALYLALSLEKMGRPGEAVEEYRRVVDQDEKPLSLEGGSALLGDLDVWRAEVVALARRRLAALDRPR
jgi:tetratricopeptide (TPR) repeat protein